LLLTRQATPVRPTAGRDFDRFGKLALGAALALPLAAFGLVGSYSRYAADDFCWAGVLRTEGFANAQAYWYIGFSPRYAFTFFVNLTELIGPAIVPVLPVTAILVALAILTWTLSQFGMPTVRAVLLAEVGVLATLQTAPDLPQSLYWQTGMLTYVLPLILATCLIGWIRRGGRTWWAVTMCGVVTFVAGGLSETYLIPQNVAITLALVACLASSRQSGRLPHLIAALCGGVLALLVIVNAPSTASRVGGSPADLWLAMSAAIATAFAQTARLVRYFPVIVLLSLAVPALIGPRRIEISGRMLLTVTAVVVLTLPFCYFPSFYAQNGNPPARSLIVPGAILIGYLMVLGLAARRFVSIRLSRTGRNVAIAALALIPIGSAVITFPQQADAMHYAALFDAEEQQIRTSRAAGQMDLTVPPLPPNLGEDFVTPDPRNWFNVCVARYYDVRSIASAS
jgi:hypothetical protein